MMKFIVAIVNRDDAGAVTKGLYEKGIHSTRLSSNSGFSGKGNSTILIGVDESKFKTVLNIIKNAAHSHEIPVNDNYENTDVVEAADFSSFNSFVQVGGATVFVLNVENYFKL